MFLSYMFKEKLLTIFQLIVSILGHIDQKLLFDVNSLATMLP